MAVRAAAMITLVANVDVAATYRWYLAQSATLNPPAVPTAHPPGGSWTQSEPGYDGTATNSLYTVDETVYSDGTYSYSLVSLSSSYEAAKASWSKADAAQSAADSAAEAADSAQESASEAAGLANAAQNTADTANGNAIRARSMTDQLEAVYAFTAAGMRTRINSSLWSTLVAEDGFYVDHEDVLGHVGAFHEDTFEPRSIRMGSVVCKATSGGGWAWKVE